MDGGGNESRAMDSVVPVSNPLAAYTPYMDRVIDWGNGVRETGRECEARLSRTGWRPSMRQRWRLIKAAGERNSDEAYFLALKEFPPSLAALTEGREGLSAGDQAYVDACREGLRLKLAKKAAVEAELSWVCENMHRDLPDVNTAPSYAAISMAIDVRTNEKVRASLWANYLSKRMTPGDKKPKEKVFVEDKEEDHDSGDREAEVARRLFGEP